MSKQCRAHSASESGCDACFYYDENKRLEAIATTLRGELAATHDHRDELQRQLDSEVEQHRTTNTERKEAERKLAVAVEALRERPPLTAARFWEKWNRFDERAAKALAVITSDAPAKDDAGPASKPLVVGQRYPVGILPIGAEVWTESAGGIEEPRSTWRITENHAGLDWTRVLVSLPSAKADEGKAEQCDVCADPDYDAPCDHSWPAPPALTRSEVVEMIVECLCLTPGRDSLQLDWVDPKQSKHKVRKIDAAQWDDVRAALSDGGAK